MKVKIEIESDEDIQSANLVFTYKGDKVAVKSVELIGDNTNNDTIDTTSTSTLSNPANTIKVPTDPNIKDSLGDMEHKEGVDESFSRPF